MKNQTVTAEMITEFLMNLSDESLATEITEIETSAVDGKFDSDTTGRRYTLLRLAQMRKEAGA